ncbi:sigma 54 modulation/S30EA ribosomal C-terminal domain-containing protein, partial [Salmonella enterica]|uniref:sigma 54 modulation/S30EA ribosomal C-terminal domain-containing protein n=1 Tax=Salmonella enterica TaxID=28901 RepID=UPI003CE9E1AF
DQVEEDDGVPHGEDPLVIAEMTTAIQTMSVSEAVMRMDLAGQTAILFKNSKTGGLNMIYKRADGNIGWIDPA